MPRAELYKRLKEGYIKGKKEGLVIADEWSRLDDAAWLVRIE
ncbi:MAG: hypothetical protein WDN10_02295 [bacterium]